MTIKPFATKQNPTADKFKIGDNVGALVAFTVSDVKDVETKFGVKSAIVADVTILDGLRKGMDYGDQLLFAAGVVRDLTDEVGNTVVARIGSWDNGTVSGYELQAPTEDDLKVATDAFPGY